MIASDELRGGLIFTFVHPAGNAKREGYIEWFNGKFWIEFIDESGSVRGNAHDGPSGTGGSSKTRSSIRLIICRSPTNRHVNSDV
jgi:hypothetical protein